MPDILPRISGTELECGISFEGDESGPNNALTAAISLHKPRYLTTLSHWLSNGARYYNDQHHVEYATPEDTSFAGTVINERAGEQIVMESIELYLRSLANTAMQKAWFNKRVIDSDRNSWGYHINLSADRKAYPSIDNRHLALLAFHLATASPMLGAGAVVNRKAKTPAYSFAQKIPTLWHDYDSGTTGTAKALINLRDEPHADKSELARIHITSTDANTSDWATWMNLGTASLVLRAVEQNTDSLADVVPEGSYNPFLALAKQTSFDVDFEKQVMLSDGRSVTSLDIQEMIIETVEGTDHTDEEAAVLAEWKEAVSDLRSDPAKLSNRSGGMAKLVLMRGKMSKLGREADDFSHRDVRAIDLMFDSLSAHTGTTPHDASEPQLNPQSQNAFAQRLRENLFTRHKVAPADIVTAMTQPPQTTRARIRSEVLTSGKVRSMGWDSYTDHEKTVHPLKDPYAA